MSIKVMGQVLEDIEVTRAQQAVLLAMANHANDHGGETFPSVDRIAWIAGYKPRAVISAMQELTEMGVLEMIAPASGRRPAEYQIHLDKAPRKRSFTEWKAANSRHRSDAKTAPLEKTRGAKTAPQMKALGVQKKHVGVHSTTRRGAVDAPEPIEPLNPTQVAPPSNVIRVEPPTPPVDAETKGNRPEHGPGQRIMAAFCDAIGIERLPNYDRAGGTARNLVKAGVTAEDIPDMVAWCFEQQWLKGGIDLDTLYRNIVRWKTDRAGRQRKPAGPPDVDLLPGEVATETTPGHWELNHPNGHKRIIDPEWCGVIYDSRTTGDHEGLQAFYKAVRKAKAERNEVAA